MLPFVCVFLRACCVRLHTRVCASSVICMLSGYWCNVMCITKTCMTVLHLTPLIEQLDIKQYLYYYSSPVFTLPSSRLGENLPTRSQFYSDHRVNFSTYRSCQSTTFGQLTFCVNPLLLRPKIIEKTTML